MCIPFLRNSWVVFEEATRNLENVLEKLTIPELFHVRYRMWQQLTQENKQAPCFWNKSTFEGRKTKVSPEDSQVQQVFFNFFTKATTYLECSFLFLRFELPLCLSWTREVLLMMTSNMLHIVFKMMDILGMNCLNAEL